MRTQMVRYILIALAITIVLAIELTDKPLPVDNSELSIDKYMSYSKYEIYNWKD